MRALALVLKTDTKDSCEATLRVVFVALGELIEETITKLERLRPDSCRSRSLPIW
ncbi:MAG: hypothetical protein ACREUC_19610 [Steroidobacteraceae bacterium]